MTLNSESIKVALVVKALLEFGYDREKDPKKADELGERLKKAVDSYAKAYTKEKLEEVGKILDDWNLEDSSYNNAIDSVVQTLGEE